MKETILLIFILIGILLISGCAEEIATEEEKTFEESIKQPISELSEEECLEKSVERIVDRWWKTTLKIDLSFSIQNKIAIIDIHKYQTLDNLVSGASEWWKQSNIKEQLLILATDLIMEFNERGCINAIDSYKMSFKGYTYTFSKYDVAQKTGFADDMDLE